MTELVAQFGLFLVEMVVELSDGFGLEKSWEVESESELSLWVSVMGLVGAERILAMMKVFRVAMAQISEDF